MLPRTRPLLARNYLNLAKFDVATLEAIYDQDDLDETLRVTLKMAFATLGTEVGQAEIAAMAPPASELLASLTNQVMRIAGLSGRFAELYPIVRKYVGERCFRTVVDVEEEAVRTHLRPVCVREGIAKYLARMIGLLTVERLPLQIEQRHMRLSEATPFQWRRNLTPQPLACAKTVFNFVATYNPYERRFAEFLDGAPDVARFASLGTTDQGEAGVRFRVEYLKPSGAIGCTTRTGSSCSR